MVFSVRHTVSMKWATDTPTTLMQLPIHLHKHFWALTRNLFGDPQSPSDEELHQIYFWRLPEHYKPEKEIGKGSFGTVIKAWDCLQSRQVAVKHMSNIFKSEKQCRGLLREVAILSHLKHENIVKIYDLPEPSDVLCFQRLYIVMECCDTDLKRLCACQQGVTVWQARQLAYGMCVGIAYLHSAAICHRDLKPANCLVNRNWTVKVCDFNMARQMSIHGSNESNRSVPQLVEHSFTTNVVTRWYRAPEVILQLPYSEAVDVWSAGCVLGQLFSSIGRSGHALFRGGETNSAQRACEEDQLSSIFSIMGTPSEGELECIRDQGVRNRVKLYGWKPRKSFKCLMPAADSAGIGLLKEMLCFLPSQRLSMAAAVKHQFFEGKTLRRSPDEGTVASGPIDIGFNEESVNLIDADDVREKLIEVIEQFHGKSQLE